MLRNVTDARAFPISNVVLVLLKSIHSLVTTPNCMTVSLEIGRNGQIISSSIEINTKKNKVKGKTTYVLKKTNSTDTSRSQQNITLSSTNPLIFFSQIDELFGPSDVRNWGKMSPR